MLISVLTIFPEMFPGPLAQSLAGKALGKSWDIKAINIRDFAKDKHKTVDDTPYGGGAGMVMKPDIIDAALKHALSLYDDHPQILFMTPRGQTFSNSLAKKIMQDTNGMIILCGRYEGIDQRVIDHWKQHHGMIEVSIGDYVLFGGEIPAMVVIDTCLRFIPGIMNNSESVVDESFSNGLLEYPQYTKPATWNDMDVPEVLLSGNHKKIDQWRQAQSEKITMECRPDLWGKYHT